MTLEERQVLKINKTRCERHENDYNLAKHFEDIACASNIDLYLTLLGLNKQLIETYGM